MSTTDTVERLVLTDDYYGYRLPVPSSYAFDLMASEDERWATLATIGVDRTFGDTPLQAWRNAVADETGVDRAKLDPAQGGALDLGFTPTYVRRFVLYLA